MRPLDAEHNRFYVQSLVAGVPRRVLEVIALGEGAREIQIIRELGRWLPSSIDTDALAGWVNQALGYLIVRGDVERGAGRVYRCVPPYLVRPPHDGATSVLRLHGDPRAEQGILDLLRDCGATLSSGTAPVEDTPMAPVESPEPALAVLERGISLAGPELVGRAASACESRGYTVLCPRELGELLPGIDGLLCPHDRDLRSATELYSGIWEVYEPRSPGEDRWQSDERWSDGGSRLLRFRQADDGAGERGARIFYHGGRGRVAQLDWESASLWQFYLDHCYGNPRAFWLHGSDVWVPSIVPVAARRWLELIAGHRARPSGQRLRFSMSHTSAVEAREAFVESLAMRPREERPPRQRYRTGIKGRR